MDDYYSLNVHQIQRDRHERDRHKYSTYKRILEKCYYKVKGCSDKDITYCTYQLPDFIFGEPIFNKIYCANYIVEHLRSNGFCCRFFEPNLLYITWTFAGARKIWRI